MTEINPNKTDEQILSEQQLHIKIEDDQANNGEQGETDNTAATALFGMLSLVPITLNIAGFKHTADVWSENACQALAAAMIPVFRKYSFGQKIIVFLETGGGVEELALMAIVAPLAISSFNAYQADLKNQQKNTEKEVKDAPKEAADSAANGWHSEKTTHEND